MLPQANYPDSTHATHSSPLNSLLTTKLREHALVLRRLITSLRSSSNLSEAEILSTVRSKKESLMKEIYTVMSATLGAPPSPDAKFVWDYYDKDGKAGTWEGTPREFFKVCHCFVLDSFRTVSSGGGGGGLGQIADSHSLVY
jgi:bleomycin hydrolase